MKPIHKPGQMNGTEQEWANLLEILKQQGGIIDYKFEGIKFKLADKTYYTPAFFVVYPDHFAVHEVKGFMMRDDAAAKFKIAAAMFPHFRWKMVQKKNKKAPWEVIRDM
jgi:hypothetical protein